MTFGRVHVGLWMKSPEEAQVMLRALEAGLRNMPADDRDRPMVMEWRKQALNFASKGKSQDWIGWNESP